MGTPPNSEFNPGNDPLPLVLPTAEEIEARYGADAAARWQAAKTYEDLRLLLAGLRSGDTARPPSPPAEMPARSEKVEEAEDDDEELVDTNPEFTKTLLLMKLYLVPEKRDELKMKKEQYEMDVSVKEVLMKKFDRMAKKLRDQITRRVIQIAIVDCALGGELTIAAVNERLAGNPWTKDIDAWDIAWEYKKYVELMVDRGQIDIDPPQQ